jgi:glycosyltransferase involved in cell wall biosynthesis
VVFVPAWNEAASVGAVVEGVRSQLPGATVLVVDDGSTDDTAEEARKAGARVAELPFNSGLGAALETGYRLAFEKGFEYCAHLDADGQHPASELPRILEPVWAGEADYVIGTRFVSDGERPPEFRSSPLRRTGIALFGALMRGSTGRRFTDITSGFRAGNKRAIELFAHVYQPDFGEIESLQRALSEGLAVEEVPVLMHHRERGASFLTPLRSFFFVFKAVVTLAVGRFRNPTRQTDS